MFPAGDPVRLKHLHFECPGKAISICSAADCCLTYVTTERSHVFDPIPESFASWHQETAG